MSFYTDNFGSYKAYRTWNGLGSRSYIIILINNKTSAEEIVKHNPSGIEKFGLQLKRHEIYHGIFENTSLDLSFSLKEDSGGQFIKDAYDSDGIKADVDAKIYRYVKSTNDFSLLYDYKINFKKDSYNYESGSNGNIITVKLNQKGSISKFGARDEIELDITKNVSVGGTTISNVIKKSILFPGIDIFLMAEANGLFWNFDITTQEGFFPYNVDVAVSPVYGELLSDQIDGRANFETIIDSKIYINDTDIGRYIRLFLEMPYTWTIYTPNLIGQAAINIYWKTYNSSDIEVSSHIIATFEKTVLNSIVQSGTGTFNYDSTNYQSIIDSGGYIKLVAVLIGSSFLAGGNFRFIFNTNNGNGTYIKISEKSLSIGDSTNACYSSDALGTKLMRLICDKTDAFIVSYMQGMDLKNIYFTSGWLLRKYNKNLIISFLDYFKSLSYSEAIGLHYYANDDKFVIRELEYFYRDEQIIDYGVVKNFRSYPSDDYISSIKAGCNQTGKYEDVQGALEFNLKYNYSIDFDENKSKDMLIPIHTDSLAIELTRRKQYKYHSAEDTEYDNDIFMVYTDGNEVIVSSNLSGFDGVEAYYNERFLPYNTLLRNKGILGGIFWKDTANKLRYISNTKDVEVTDSSGISNKDDILQSDLEPGYFYPEVQEFEPLITIDELKDLRTDPYGYYKCTDEDGNIHYGYHDIIDVQDSEKSMKVVGRTANRNR